MRSQTASWQLEQWIKKLKCSGCTGTELESFRDVNVGVDSAPVSSEAEACQISDISQKDNRSIFSSFRFAPSEVAEIVGKSDDGILDGKVKIKYKDGRLLNGYFKEGILHGFARYFDSEGRLVFAGQHRDGRPVGTCWLVLQGGGCVVGQVDTAGHLTGPCLAYIYPDHSTALLGQFSDGVMISGREHVVVGLKEDSCGVKVPVFDKSPTDHLHKRQIGCYNYICDDPTVPDPYECQQVEVLQSQIPGACEGLFAKVDIETGTTVAFYNGSRADPNEFDPESWETNNYRIYDPGDVPHGTIDIPRWAQDRSQYCASLAHKCNHSFTPNAQFVVFDHPKFGLIPSVSSTSDIRRGEEITVGYGYDIKLAPDWYKADWEQSIFGRQGVEYQDWLECTIKLPLALN